MRHGRCIGVSYLRDGELAEAHAFGEVIVCAGAIGSAQLLLLSGIGPAAQLRALSIDVVADLPGVGENLQREDLRLPLVDPALLGKLIGLNAEHLRLIADLFGLLPPARTRLPRGPPGDR